MVAPRTGEANNLSMRRLEDTPEMPPPGTFRILSYGDSVGSGYGVAVDGMYAHIVEQKLNERGQRRHEVLTMARGNSRQSTATTFERTSLVSALTQSSSRSSS